MTPITPITSITPDKNEELILVVPRKCLKEVGMFQGFNPRGEKYLKALIDTQRAIFTKRGPAEQDPNWKQIIPYCVIVQDKKILVYQRGSTSGESRLKNLWSCGIGGHINPVDSTQANTPFTRLSLKRALLREISEEILLPPGEVKFTTAGLINDDSNPVGQVHLGLVEIARVPSGTITPLEDVILNLKLVTMERLLDKRQELENWSQIVADHIHKIIEKLY